MLERSPTYLVPVCNYSSNHLGFSFAGEKILLGAGGPIEPFWNLYAVHQTPEVLGMLEEYRIGKLKAGDRVRSNILITQHRKNNFVK